MAKFFGDIAKSVKDVLTGAISFENKYDYSTKTSQGVGIKGNLGTKGEDFTASASASYSIDKISLDGTLNEDGELKATVSHAGLHPGLKATLSGQPINLGSWKVATQYLFEEYGVKADLSNIISAPKIDASVCYNLGSSQVVGVETTLCSSKGLSKLNVAYQQVVEGYTVAAVVADMGDTYKASCFKALEPTLSVAAEAVFKMGKGDLSVSAGAVKKLPNGHTVKAVASSKGTLSSSYTGKVSAATTGTACLQIDTSMNYKYGFQFATK